jgi:hypothetical protein
VRSIVSAVDELSVCFAAELGLQAPLIHVDTPNRGKIQACSAIHPSTNKAATSSSIFVAPFRFIRESVGSCCIT